MRRELSEIYYKFVAKIMVQVVGQSIENKIEKSIRGKGRGSIVFQQDYADFGTPSAVNSTFFRLSSSFRISL